MANEYQHYNFGQKIFEIGEKSSIAITNWGLSSLKQVSYRTLFARLGDSFASNPPEHVSDAAWRWNAMFLPEYIQHLGPLMERAKELHNKGDGRTEQETKELEKILGTGAGFCIGGHCGSMRQPEAFEMSFEPYHLKADEPRPVPLGHLKLWGWPALMNRLQWGIDERVYSQIIKSGKWTGTPEELAEIVLKHSLKPPVDVPLREAIDYVYAAIYTTIKSLKFSQIRPVCGGPIEIAVITTDRRFRWVLHKSFESALAEARSIHARFDPPIT